MRTRVCKDCGKVFHTNMKYSKTCDKCKISNVHVWAKVSEEERNEFRRSIKKYMLGCDKKDYKRAELIFGKE